MPKKRKKAKLPLSDEEQLLLFQQKLLAEEEMAKKKERLLSQFLKVMAFCITPPNPTHSLHWPCRLDPLIVAACFHAGLPSSGNLESQTYLGFWQHCLGRRQFFVKHRGGQVV